MVIVSYVASASFLGPKLCTDVIRSHEETFIG